MNLKTHELGYFFFKKKSPDSLSALSRWLVARTDLEVRSPNPLDHGDKTNQIQSRWGIRISAERRGVTGATAEHSGASPRQSSNIILKLKKCISDQSDPIVLNPMKLLTSVSSEGGQTYRPVRTNHRAACQIHQTHSISQGAGWIPTMTSVNTIHPFGAYHFGVLLRKRGSGSLTGSDSHAPYTRSDAKIRFIRGKGGRRR